MLATHLGFYNTATTRTHVRFQFSTHAAAGGNVAPASGFEAADVRIYKAADGAAFSATQRSSSSGITMTSPFDSLTGFHDVDIDLTDNTDAGFYASGSLYSIVLAPDTETVDSQTITGIVLAYFEIGVRKADVTQWNGTAVSSPATAGIPEVNIKNINNVAASSVTTVNANVGTTQPINFTGTAGSALAKSDVVDIAGAAVSTSTAQLGVNVVNNAGSAITSASGVQEVKVQSIAANAITATSIAADAITDAKVAADVTIASVTGAVGSVTGAVGSVTGAVGSVTGAVGSVTGNVGGNVTGSIGSLAAQAKTDVNGEVVDALNVDTYAEPGQEAPAATTTLVKKIGYLYKMLRNKKTQTSTTFSLYADDATTVDQKATVSDDGTTASRSEIASGP